MYPFRFLKQDKSYTRTEQHIIDYITRNLSETLLLSIGQLAKALGTSEASISRFVRHAGYKDFKELKNEIADSLQQESPSLKLSSTISKNHSADLLSFIQYQQYCMNKTLELIDSSSFSGAIDTILSAKKVWIHGKGAARSLGSLLEFRLKRFGIEVDLLPEAGSPLFEDLIHMRENDCVILFSFQKLTRETKVLLAESQKAHYKTILFTGKMLLPGQCQADYNLYVYRGEPEEYHSMTVATALIDALVILIAKRLGKDSVTDLSRLYNLKQNYKSLLPG